MYELYRNLTGQHVIFRVVDSAGDPVLTLDHTNTIIKAKVGISGAFATLTIADLAAHTAAWVSGGFKHIGSGKYIYHVPDEVPAAPETDRSILFELSSASVLGDKTVDLQVRINELQQLSAEGLLEVETVSWGENALASMLDDVDVETNITLRTMLRRIYAALVGLSNGPTPGAAGTVRFRSPDNTRDRLSMPVDANGYRTGPAAFDDGG